MKAAWVDERRTKGPSRGVRLFPFLAAAAAVVVVSIGAVVWQSWRAGGAQPFRGEDGELRLTVREDADQVVAEWSDVEGAESYRVQAFDPEGRSLLESETGGARLVVPRRDLGNEASRALWRVQALDSLKRSIAESGLVASEPPP